MKEHPFRLSVRQSADQGTGGMPDIPLVLLCIDDQGCSLSRAVEDACRYQGFLFSHPQRKVACFWAHPHLVMSHIHQRLIADLVTGGLRPFGCIPPDGFTHPGTPDMNPIGVAVRFDSGVRRVFGAAGVSSLRMVCSGLFRGGLECPELKDRIAKIAAARLPAPEHRRAEDEVTSI